MVNSSEEHKIHKNMNYYKRWCLLFFIELIVLTLFNEYAILTATQRYRIFISIGALFTFLLLGFVTELHYKLYKEFKFIIKEKESKKKENYGKG